MGFQWFSCGIWIWGYPLHDFHTNYGQLKAMYSGPKFENSICHNLPAPSPFSLLILLVTCFETQFHSPFGFPRQFGTCDSIDSSDTVQQWADLHLNDFWLQEIPRDIPSEQERHSARNSKVIQQQLFCSQSSTFTICGAK